MSDIEKTETTDKSEREPEIQSVLADSPAEEQEKTPVAESGLRDRLRKFLDAGHLRSGTTTDMKKDRTRTLTILIGAIVGVMLLFIGGLSRPTRPPVREPGVRTTANLGRPSASDQSEPVRGSVTPLLNADIQSEDIHADQLSPADIRGTSRRPTESDQRESLLPEPAKVDTARPRLPSRQAIVAERENSYAANYADPVAGSRLNNATGTPTASYSGPPVSRSGAEPSQTYSYGGGASTSSDNRRSTVSSVHPSIVFVRAPEAAASVPSMVAVASSQTSLLPSGTRLAARLESAATTAVKTPVIASIEYNYERDGMIIVPAGTKVVGDVQQASTEGYVNIRFHTLQMPNGRDEVIEATGVALDHKPLKGAVSGKNTGKKILSRTLSGVGTVAAYVVGAGGSGLGRTITGETLLRDRLASNIAMAGEQELMNAAHSQNISVTIPANTRFYVVLQKSAANTITPSPPRIAEPAAQSAEKPTIQELRELMDLRREINRMYQDSNASSEGMNPF